MAEREFRHIVRIANTDIKGGKDIVSALRLIRGVGFAVANSACRVAQIERGRKAGELTDDEIKRLNEVVVDVQKHLPVWMLNRRKDYETGADRHLLTSELEFARQEDVRRLQRVKAYKGLRHSMGLPVRGQRTRSNFRRNKGKVLGVIKKKVIAQKGGEEKGEKKREKK